MPIVPIHNNNNHKVLYILGKRSYKWERSDNPLMDKHLVTVGRKNSCLTGQNLWQNPGEGGGCDQLGVIGKRREQDKRLTIGKESLNFIIIRV